MLRSPTPSSPAMSSSARTRIRWESIAIIVMAASIAAVIVAFIYALPDTHHTPQPSRATAAAGTSTPTDAAAATTGVTGGLTREDSSELVAEATDLLRAGRFDEAADRLASVPTQWRQELAVDELSARIDATKARYEQLRVRAQSAVDAAQWDQAHAVLTEMASMAQPDADVRQLQALVDDHARAATRGDLGSAARAETKEPAATADDPAAAPRTPSAHATNAAPARSSAARGPATTPPAAGTAPTPTRPSPARTTPASMPPTGTSPQPPTSAPAPSATPAAAADAERVAAALALLQ